MRKFLKNILLFSIIIIVALAVGEVVVRRVATPYVYKDRWLRTHGGRVSTLVLGSSHTYYGVRSELLGDSAFNLANISQTPEYDFALLQQYLPMMPNLRRVIIPISYFTFRDPKLEEMAPGVCVDYKVGMGLRLHSDWSRYNFVITNFVAYRGRLMGLVKHQESNICDSLGFGLGYTAAGKAPNWEEWTADRIKGLTQESPGRAAEVKATLRRMIGLLRSRGVECVLVTTPVWHTFSEQMDTSQWNEAQRLTRQLVDSCGARYYSWLDSPVFAADDFYDIDHLSDVGAAKFTRLLRQAIDSVK